MQDEKRQHLDRGATGTRDGKASPLPANGTSAEPERTHLTPEVREWALRQFTEEEIIASLREVWQHSGPELGELIRELEQELGQP